ncbi:MAG: hypothetical protein QW607_09725 [Desulfurococcaceae archaeon]
MGEIIKPIMVMAILPPLLNAFGFASELGPAFNLVLQLLPLAVVLSIIDELDFGGGIGEMVKPLITLPFLFGVINALGIASFDTQMLGVVQTLVILGVILKVFESL